MAGKKEEWIPLEILGIKKGMYLISDRGKIYSLKSKKKLKLIKKHNGYYRVNLQLELGRQKEISSHRLVAISFSPIPDGFDNFDDLEVNHKRGDKSKNKKTDLEWVTPSENIKHSFRTGMHPIKYGIESTNHKYSEETVRDICKALEDNHRGSELLEFLGLDNSYANLVKRIKTRRHWTHISKDYTF